MEPKILVVDDDIESWHSVSAILHAHHYHAMWAADSIRAMSAARQYQPNAILLDLGLPDRASFVLLERLKQNRLLSAIPVIVMTVQDPEVTEQPAKEHGAIAFLRKPLKVDELISTIRKTLHQKE